MLPQPGHQRKHLRRSILSRYFDPCPGAPQLACQGRLEPGGYHDLIPVVPLLQYLRLAVYLREQLSIGQRQPYLGQRFPRSGMNQERPLQRLQPVLRNR